jgi:hypothetical protein
MPSLELKIAAENSPRPLTRLRRLLEKPGAAILRRNYVPEVPGYEDPIVRNAFRVTAVLAVDLSNPPEETEKPLETSPTAPPADESQAGDSSTSSFAKGLEIWVADRGRATCVFIDEDEIPGARAMFDAYLRLARYAPAFQRLEQRSVGLQYAFREGLHICVLGSPAETEPHPDAMFEGLSPIPQFSDFRATSFTIRLPGNCIGYLHDSLRAATAWLDENSYANILGSK